MAANATHGSGRPVSVGIVGGGFGGVGMGIRLKRAGIEDFTIYERGETVGGVWRANTYPGAGCDVPSHLYSFSFAPGHDWSRRFAPGAEIVRYMERIVSEEGLEPHLRLGTEAESATFDPSTGRWTLRTTDGDEREFDVLVTACGQLTNPAIPDVPGAEDFEGPSFHSAAWDHDHDLSGERVAVIGTGASAIQFVPRIAPDVERLTIYQRSAPWIVPKNDRPYADWEQRLFRAFPPRVAAARLANAAIFEAGTYMFTGTQWLVKALGSYSDRTRRAALAGNPELIEKTTPDTEMGCKRVLITSEWFETLKRDNVELVAGPVERITKDGVVGPDGVERPADTIIWSTGFQSHDFVAPMRIEGPGGELNEVWADRPEAYLGTTVAGFPNMFVMYGPNTNHGSGSVPYTLECQYHYVMDAIRRLREDDLSWIDVKPEVMERWRREMEERSATTQWVTGGHNWYVNSEGVNTNNWPGPWLEYRRRTARLNPGDYRAARLDHAASPVATGVGP